MTKIILFIALMLSPHQAKASYSPQIGELCSYSLYFMGMKAGSMTTNVVSKEKVNEKDVLVLTNEIKTEGFISKFYTLLKKTKSFWNNNSIRHEFEIKENSNEKSGSEVFNPESKEMIYTKNEESKTYLLPNDVQDQTSIFYYARQIDWAAKDEVSVDISDYGSIEKVILKKIKKEDIEKKSCYKISVQQGKMENFFWIAEDETKEILKIKVATNSGDLSGTLDNCIIKK